MAAESSETSPRVTGLNIFPVKSCKALRVQEIEVDSYGIVDDRRFMLVDGNGRFTSQRKFSKLATVSARFVEGEEEREVDGKEEDGKEKGEEEDDRGGGRKHRKRTRRLLCVSAPGMVSELRFVPRLQGERRDVSVWQSEVRVVDQGDKPAQWFSEAIGIGSTYHRLVASAEGEPSTSQSDCFHRLVDNLPSSLSQRLPPMKLALADAGPVSLVSTESLADLNHKLQERVDSKVALDRFRMNIEISGCSRAFEEDEWLLVRIGTVPFLAYTNAEASQQSVLYVYM